MGFETKRWVPSHQANHPHRIANAKITADGEMTARANQQIQSEPLVSVPGRMRGLDSRYLEVKGPVDITKWNCRPSRYESAEVLGCEDNRALGFLVAHQFPFSTAFRRNDRRKHRGVLKPRNRERFVDREVESSWQAPHSQGSSVTDKEIRPSMR